VVYEPLKVDKRVDAAILWFGWTAASVLGLEAAFWIAESTRGRLYFGLGLAGFDPEVRGIVLIPVQVGILGAALGLGQWLVLRRFLTDVGRWPVMTALGSLVAAPVLMTIAALSHRLLAPPEALVYAAFTGCVFGICIALGQLAVLRKTVSGVRLWLVAGVAGYGLGTVFAMALSVFAGFPYVLDNAAIGAIDGAITGLALVQLIARHRPLGMSSAPG
jgi:hypothetical protein